MKKISDLIKESGSQEFTITATVTFKVTAESEGDAGYTADSIIEGIEGYVSHEIGNVGEISEAIRPDGKISTYIEVDYAELEEQIGYSDKLEELGIDNPNDGLYSMLKKNRHLLNKFLEPYEKDIIRIEKTRNDEGECKGADENWSEAYDEYAIIVSKLFTNEEFKLFIKNLVTMWQLGAIWQMPL